jgi:hypothetical protein
MDSILLENKEVIHASIRTWEVLQNMIKTVAEVGKVFDDNYILSGLENVDGVISPGVVVYNGEILPCDGAVYYNGIRAYVSEVKEQVVGESGGYDLYNIRKLVLGGGSSGSAAFSDFKQYRLRHSQAMQFGLNNEMLNLFSVSMESGYTVGKKFARIFINIDGTVRLEGSIIVVLADTHVDWRNIFAINTNIFTQLPNFTLADTYMFADDCSDVARICCETAGKVMTFKFSNTSGSYIQNQRLSFVMTGKII